MGSLAAVRTLRCSDGTGEDGMDNPWPFRASLDIHQELPARMAFPSKNIGVLWIILRCFISMWRCAVLGIALLADRRRNATGELTKRLDGKP